MAWREDSSFPNSLLICAASLRMTMLRMARAIWLTSPLTALSSATFGTRSSTTSLKA